MSSFHIVSLLALGLLPHQAAASVHQVKTHRVRSARNPVVSVVADVDNYGMEDGDAHSLRKLDGDEDLVYDHMPKAGGTFLIQLLRNAVGARHFGFEAEFDNLTQEDVDTSFVIGSMRNPCDYYLSLWAFGVDQGGAMARYITDKEPEMKYLYQPKTQYKNSTDDIGLFHDWVRIINRRGHPGVMSIRVAQSYAVLDKVITSNAPPKALANSDLDAVGQALSNSDFMERVDCWIQVDDMDAGARRCLTQWEKDTGFEVDWDAYDRSFNNSDQLSSYHGTCTQYFTPKLAQLVQDLEAPLFNYFRYESCCA